jgi:hypothetical protein
MKSLHILSVLIFIGLFIGYFFVGLIAYWLFWPYQTLVVNTNPAEVVTPYVERGQYLQYILDFCKYSNAPVTVHRTLDDGQIVFLQDTEGQLPLGCRSTISSNVIIPQTINTGVYYLNVTADYQVNPIRTVSVHYVTQKFTVIK